MPQTLKPNEITGGNQKTCKPVHQCQSVASSHMQLMSAHNIGGKLSAPLKWREQQMFHVRLNGLQWNCNRREGQIKALLGTQPKLITVVARSDHKQDRERSRRRESSNRGKAHSLSYCQFRSMAVQEGMELQSLAQQIQFPNLFWCRNFSKGGCSGGQG